MHSLNQGFGPMPKGDRQDTLQQLSLTALRAALPASKFLVRDGRGDDKGVDGDLEAKLDGCFLNCRAQFQLKATDSGETNLDGSVSCRVAASNLNHLTHGPCPIYFLWIAPRDEMRFVWAHNERRRITNIDPAWMEQGTVTIRFVSLLTPAAVDEILARALREAQFHQRMHDTLARTTTAGAVRVRIDSDTLATTDPTQAEQVLWGGGAAIVAAGYGLEVLDLVKLLDRERAAEPRIQLIAAYANHSLGKHQAALASLGEAEARNSGLTAEDRRFLGSLRDACNFSLGRLSLDEYLERQRKWADEMKGVAALQHRLEALRHAQLHERDDRRRRELGQQFRETARAIVETGNDTVSKLQALILLANEEGEGGVRDFLRVLTLIRMREGMKQSGLGPVAGQAQAMKKRLAAWEHQAERVAQLARDARHPLLLGDALLGRLTVRIGILMHQWFDAAGSGSPWSVPDQVQATLVADAEAASSIYSRAGNAEGECRAKLFLADISDITGRLEEARRHASAVLPVARGMGYASLEERALEHLENRTILRRFESTVAEFRATDSDYYIAAHADEELTDLSCRCIESRGLPPERLPNVLIEWQSQRRISQERISWCRHLELLQVLTHERHPSTHYAENPPRFCRCEKYNYRSVLEYPDYEVVIDAFKGSRCKGCPSREPKSERSE